MIRYRSEKQLLIEEFKTPVEMKVQKDSRQESERIIDLICATLDIENPRTYRRNARKAYLDLAKKKHKTKKEKF
ncbi:MAG: hypothetical protein EOM90_14065 [Alphaproteobacteria bacterium]|nr:hypothetical protein [Alphaproteobacteria bacterium]